MENSDFLSLDQTPQGFDVDLDLGDLTLDESDVTAAEGFEYPALVLGGVAFQDCLKVLKTCQRSTFRPIDVWIDLEDGSTPSKFGELPLALETLLVMRYLGIRVTAYFSSEQVELLNLSDTELLEKYM